MTRRIQPGDWALIAFTVVFVAVCAWSGSWR